MILEIDLKEILMGKSEWGFLLEVVFRSFLMYVIILVSLRILGRRSINQLSVFELGVIIGLGSAAGDPMFYKEVGLLPGIVVFVTIISLYRIMAWLINSNEKVEKLLEGEPIYLLRNGKIDYENFQSQTIGMDDFNSLLRQHKVVHLGQVEYAIIETNGTLSAFYYADEDVKPGLPILPHFYDECSVNVKAAGVYACSRCGQLHEFNAPNEAEVMCENCGYNQWLEAIKNKRIG